MATTDSISDRDGESIRVLIAGAGVAGLEAALALSRHAPGLVDIELLAPGDTFVYRPLQVAEPFGIEAKMEFDLDRLVEQTGARRVRGSLVAVDPGRRTVRTRAGAELAYDALVVALGARPTESIPGAITFGTVEGHPAFANLLKRLGRPGWRRIAFVVPPGAAWTIAAYELAMLTAAETKARGLIGVELFVVTGEPGPLAAFGAEASQYVGSRLSDAGIGIHTGTAAVEQRGGALIIDGAEPIECDHAVALPALAVEPLPGLPQRAQGFLPTDVGMRVAGLESVWAAGDVAGFPIKQGGLAAQQADVAARAIAIRAGARVVCEPLRPTLRAALITGGPPEFLRFHRGDPGEAAAHSHEPLWWPPEKLAGRYLAPLLAAENGGISFGALMDLDPPADPVAADRETDQAAALLLAAADADARAGHLSAALSSLELAERLTIALPPEYVARRERLRRRLDPNASNSAAAGRIDPTLVSTEAALSDLHHRVGRLRELEREVGRGMRGDLSHLEEGLQQLRRLSRETGLLEDGG